MKRARGREEKRGNEDEIERHDTRPTGHDSGTDDSTRSLRNQRKINNKKSREELNEKEKERYPSFVVLFV